jgi:RNA polymerase sigma factor (sigma-70 family)
LQSDFELVKAVLEGRTELYEQLVLRYEASIKAICHSVLVDSHLAADATQDTFVKAYEKLPTLRNPKVFGSWLMRIGKRRALDMLSQQQKETSLKQAISQETYHGNGELDDAKRQLLSALLDLPEHEQHVIMLRYFEGHSVRNVASMAGRSVGTVTKQLSRAHRRLKNILLEAE